MKRTLLAAVIGGVITLFGGAIAAQAAPLAVPKTVEAGAGLVQKTGDYYHRRHYHRHRHHHHAHRHHWHRPVVRWDSYYYAPRYYVRPHYHHRHWSHHHHRRHYY